MAGFANKSKLLRRVFSVLIMQPGAQRKPSLEACHLQWALKQTCGPVIVWPMNVWKPLLLAVLCWVWLGACSSDGKGSITVDPGDAIDNDTPVTPRSADACDPSTDDQCEPGADGLLCTPCVTDADCEEGFCVEDARGVGFCSSRCDYFGDTICPRWYYCKQFGDTPKDFYCSPLSGVCEDDGSDCSSCKTDEDCNEGLTCYEPLGDIRFCARPCSSNADCPEEYGKLACGEVDDESVETPLCMPKILGVPTPKCGALPLGFCEPCETPGQCKTGLCVNSPNVGQVCSIHCTENTNCPSGTFCIQGSCLPPVAYGCQGFLSCLGVECPAGEDCYRGFCLDGP